MKIQHLIIAMLICNFSTPVTCCQSKYIKTKKFDIKEHCEITPLKHLCKKVAEEHWENKVDQVFIASKYKGLKSLKKTLIAVRRIENDAERAKLTQQDLNIGSIFNLSDNTGATLVDIIMARNSNEYNATTGITLLLNHGLNKYTYDENHNSLLHTITDQIVIEPNLHQLIPIILQHQTVTSGKYLTPDEHAIKNSLLLNMRNAEGHTALYKAAEAGHTKICTHLLTANANVEIPNYEGNTPLHEAIYNGHTKIAKKLIPYYKNINILNNASETPFKIAVNQQNHKLIELLMNNGGGYGLHHNKKRKFERVSFYANPYYSNSNESDSSSGTDA